jgi:hypothetical protein
MTVVFLNELSPVERAARLEPMQLASRGLAPPDLPVVVLSPDASSASPDDAHVHAAEDSLAPTEAAGDQTQHALLYGRYLVQVQARIERAWMRPRAEIGAPRFSCRARIAQDRHGDVIGIRLDHCNGTQRWQQSLLSAIRTASPLPAPPDPSVYADSLWLNFESEGFRPGGSPEGFEPENSDARVASARSPAAESFEHFRSQTDRNFESSSKDGSKVIHLTIIGSAEGAIPVGSARPPSSEEPLPDAAREPSSPQ